MSIIPGLSSVSITVVDNKVYTNHFPEWILLRICSIQIYVIFRILSSNLCYSAVNYKHSISNVPCDSILLFFFLSISHDS